MKRVTFSWYILTLIGLFVYSYSQIDLNLTLSSHPLYQSIQQQLIHLGYFNRLLSTFLYLLLLSSFFLVFISLIHQAKSKTITSSNIIKLVLTTSFLLTLAYPAFSHDIYNYIFDTRILIHHHASPWTHTALDFPSDLWTRFMHWTHRTYPYGPTWLFLTIPFYLMGLGKFTLTLISFKLLGVASFLLSCYCIYRLAHKFHRPHTTTSLALFAFNPLVIIESLISFHLDITMTAFMLLALFLFSHKRPLPAWLSLLISILTKYTTTALIPFAFLYQSHRLSFSQFIRYSFFASLFATILVITQRELLPWYFLPSLGLAALLPTSRQITIFTFSLSLSLLLRYLPFLYIGSYTLVVYQSRNILTLISFLTTYLILTKFSKKLLSSS